MGQGRDAVTKNSDAPKVQGAPHPDFPQVTGLLPEPKRLWLEALRSDRFKQGRNMLAKDEGDGMQFCCLGVLCEVAIEAGLDLEREERSDLGSKRSLSYGGGYSVMPPEEVWKWAWGTSVGVGQVVITEDGGDGEHLVMKDLTHLNDDEGWTFEQIADAIEESL